MKRSLATSLAVAVASPLVAVAAIAGASPAQAALPCDTPYPAGSAYKVSIAPSAITIRKGSQITLYSRVTRGQTGCNGQTVRYFTRNSSQPRFISAGYTATRTTSLGDGFANRVGAPPRTFAWLVQFKSLYSGSGTVFVR